jgi:hypothetical protein
MPKPSPDIRQEYDEGPPAAKAFDVLVRDVLKVPRAAVDEQRAANERTKQRKRA